MKSKLVYVMDPLCGWCYGNGGSMAAALAAFPGAFEVEVLPGGMWAGENRKRQTARLAAIIRAHDAEVTARTGAVFGAEYDRRLALSDVVLDSEPPSRAIVAAQSLWPDRAYDFAFAVLTARFAHGLDLGATATYRALARDLRLDGDALVARLESREAEEETRGAFVRAARYARVYPTLIVEQGGAPTPIASGYAPPMQLVAALARLTT